MSPLLALLVVIAPQNAELAKLQVQSKELTKKPWPEIMAGQPKINEAIFALAEKDRLKTAEEYRIASGLLMEPNNALLPLEAKYELGYTAVVLGDEPARKPLATDWDALMMALGRHRPMAALKLTGEFPITGHWVPDLAPEPIRKIWLGETKADPILKDNEEIAAMFKADQEIRQKGQETKEAMIEMMKGDVVRLARIKEMVTAGEIKTGEDYYKAAFLFQHGGAFEEYQMAHQLAVCSVLLGKNQAKWIGAATYDRMLGSCSQEQRWATQYRGVNGIMALSPCGTQGIGEAERKTVTGHTLAEAKKRKL